MKLYIKQKVFALKDKFKVTDENQNPVYEVKGKFVSLTNKLELIKANGDAVLRSNRKVLTILPKYFIYDLNDKEVAAIQRRFSFFKPKFDLNVLGRELEVEGNMLAHAFNINENNHIIATIQKRYISWGDTYEIEVFEEDNLEVFLFVVIIIDQIIHEKKNNRVFS